MTPVTPINRLLPTGATTVRTSPARAALQQRAARVLVARPTAPSLHLGGRPTRIRLSGTLPV